MSCPVRLSERNELHKEHREVLKLALNFLSTQPGCSAANPAVGLHSHPFAEEAPPQSVPRDTAIPIWEHLGKLRPCFPDVSGSE